MCSLVVVVVVAAAAATVCVFVLERKLVVWFQRIHKFVWL
jgi:hypothetical protein